jgi:hypothetical protein
MEKLSLTEREIQLLKLALTLIITDRSFNNETKREADMLTHKLTAALNEAKEKV